MTSEAGQARPPIVDYPPIAATYHGVRAAVAVVGASAAAIFGMARSHPSWSLAALLAAGMGVHALLRRRHPDRSPVPSLLLDTGLVMAVVALVGLPALAGAPLLGYMITAAFLFLPLRKAFVTTAAMASAGAALFLLDRSAATWSEGHLAAALPAVLALGALVAIFVVTSGEVEAFRERQRAALEGERKASRMKNEFVSMVSHELRTPLTSIAGFAETLRESWSGLEPREVEEFLAIITEQAAHLSELVEDILVIPRLEAGRLRLEPSLFELRPVAYRIADVLFPSGGPKEASVSIPGGLMVWADESRVRQVLRNLLENARKYGGDQVLVEGYPRGERLVVVVSDNGPGVPEEDRQRIFDPFEQLSKGDARKETGIGLGLPIARNLIRAMGGELWYEPRFPTGARFCFTLSLHAVTEEEEAPADTYSSSTPP